MAQQYGTGENITFKMAGPFAGGGGVSAKIIEITLPVANWKGGESPYSQEVDLPEVSINSMVKLHPSVEQIEDFRENAVAFTTENEDGKITVYAIGDKPTTDYTIQATIKEVVA